MGKGWKSEMIKNILISLIYVRLGGWKSREMKTFLFGWEENLEDGKVYINLLLYSFIKYYNFLYYITH